MPVRTERVLDHVAEVVLDVPPVTAMTRDVFLVLARHVPGLGCDPTVHALLVRPAVGRGFAAGVDVGELARGGPRAVVEVTRACADAYAAVYECAVPVVAAVHGFCLATGVGLVGNADVVIAAADATFGLPEVDAGGLGTAAPLAPPVPGKKAPRLPSSGPPVRRPAPHPGGARERRLPPAA